MMKKVRGYLTVYVALSLIVMLSLFFAVLEGVRQNTISLEAELIADTGINSVLAEYHRELFNRYNVFFLDTSFGSAQSSLEAVENHLQNYLGKNCNMEDVLLGNYLYRDFLAMEVLGADITKAAVATDWKGGVFRERAIEAVKDDIGLSYLQTVISWLNAVEENHLGESDLEKQKEQIDKEIASYDGYEKMVDEEWVTIEVEDPTAPLESKTSAGILHLVVKDVSSLSSVGVNTGGLISARRKQGKMNQGNWDQGSGDSLLDRVLFTEYILRYCGYYGNPLDKGLLKYQVEYLVSGKNNDLDNLKNVVYRLSAIREAANAVYLFANPAKSAQAESVALAAATAMLLPEIAPLLKTTILLGWAYAESLYDVKRLLEGKKVSLFKTDETWHYDISCVLEGLLETDDSGSPEKEEGGLGYGDYLRILLLLSSLETQTFRLLDIVEMDIRQTEGNRNFRIDACIDRLEAKITFHSAFGYFQTVRRKAKYQ